MVCKTYSLANLPPNYEIIKPISMGAFSQVYLAKNYERIQQNVVLKVFHCIEPFADEKSLMFSREVYALQKMSHPSSIRYLSHFSAGEYHCLELAYIPGSKTVSDLFEYVQHQGYERPSLEWRLTQSIQLIDALKESHSHAIVHRDIKPRNVLWNQREEELYLSDFGIAAVFPLILEQECKTTLRSYVSPPYASPEQLLQEAPTTHFDVYSMGLLVASIINLKEVTREDDVSQLDCWMKEAYDELAFFVGDIEIKRLHNILVRCLLSPQERPPLDALSAILQSFLSRCIPKKKAGIILTKIAKSKMRKMNMSNHDILEDLNQDLYIKKGDKERYKLFGKSVFVVLKQDEDELIVIDIGINPEPIQYFHKKHTKKCSFDIYFGSGGEELLDFIHEQGSLSQIPLGSDADVLFDIAHSIVQIEKERIPDFIIDGQIQLATHHNRHDQRRAYIAGYKHSQHEKVHIRTGCQIYIHDLSYTIHKHERKRAHTSSHDHEVSVEEEDLWMDWIELIDDSTSLEVWYKKKKIGMVSGYNQQSRCIDIVCEESFTVPKRAEFRIIDQMQKRILERQDVALQELRKEPKYRSLAHHLSCREAHSIYPPKWVDPRQSYLRGNPNVASLLARMLANQPIFVLQGPPGTGKTTMIVELIEQNLSENPNMRILVCSQSNTAVDNVLERLIHQKELHQESWYIVRDVRAELAKEYSWSGKDKAYQNFAHEVLSCRSKHDSLMQNSWYSFVKTGGARVQEDFLHMVQVWGSTTARAQSSLRLAQAGMCAGA